MPEAQHLADQLVAFFSNRANPWIVPFADALEDLGASDAARRPHEGGNSVWAVANHVALWHSIVLRRLRGSPLPDEVALESGWSLPASGDEAAWTSSRERCRALNAELAALVASLADADLERPWAPGRARGWQLLHGLMNHTSYHTAEVIRIRESLGLWPR